MSDEIWKDITGQEGYQVSNYGRVRTFHKHADGKVMKLSSNRRYLKVSFRNTDTALVHRLVAEAFMGKIPDGMEVNHKDGNRLNNHVGNLEIITPQENKKHAIAMGLRGKKPSIPIRPRFMIWSLTWHIVAKRRGILPEYELYRQQPRLTDDDVRAIKKLIATGNYRINQIAKMYGVHPSLVSHIKGGRKWKHVK